MIVELIIFACGFSLGFLAAVYALTSTAYQRFEKHRERWRDPL